MDVRMARAAEVIPTRSWWGGCVAWLPLLVLLQACSGGDGAPIEPHPVAAQPSVPLEAAGMMSPGRFVPGPDGFPRWQPWTDQRLANAAAMHWSERVPGELLVRFRADAHQPRMLRALDKVGGRVTRSYRSVPGLQRVTVARAVDLANAVAVLARDPAVEFVEPNYVVRELAMPDDARFGEQWALQHVGQYDTVGDEDIDAPEAWDLVTGSENVVVAVIDGGIDAAHPDLRDNLWRNPWDCNADGVDDDSNGYVDDCVGIDLVDGDSDPGDIRGHGTHVAGIIGASGNNGLGIAGVAWQVRLLACRFLNDEGAGNVGDAIACLDYVAALRDRGVNILATNNSWGGGPPSRALEAAVRGQRVRGILLVAAAGNEKTINDVFPHYPCNIDIANVICVGATSLHPGRASFSNVGRRTVDLFAPGDSILSTTPGETYAINSGTSMAAPHVTGVLALLAAQDPGRDWRALKNLVLSSVERLPLLEGIAVSAGRLNAFRAVTCSDHSLLAPLAPVFDEGHVRAIGDSVVLSALHVRCAAPGGAVAVEVMPGGERVLLADDGSGGDEVAGDGIYTGRWVARNAGEYQLSFIGSGAPPVRVTVDAMLRRGFPVSMLGVYGTGFFWQGAGNHILVGEVDGDPGLEVLVSGLELGPLYAWNDDGTAVPGWPVLDAFSTAYPVLGEFDGDPDKLEIATRSFYGGLRLYSGNGVPMPGWPQSVPGDLTPPAAMDLDDDGFDEVIVFPTLRADGSIYQAAKGIPPAENGWRLPGAISVADLDGDGGHELIYVDRESVWAWNQSGVLPGFPATDATVETLGLPSAAVTGDVDGDGSPEIVIVRTVLTPDVTMLIKIFGWNGRLKRTIVAQSRSALPGAPVLADLDGDGIPEIVAQTNDRIEAWRGDGAVVQGWPVYLGADAALLNGAPVVGDLDGDGLPEVAALHGLSSRAFGGSLRVFDRSGHELPGFPKAMPSYMFGTTPAIADLDRDGRNELLVAPAPEPGERDALFVYELSRAGTHGPIEWGQYMADERHTGHYVTGKNLAGQAFLSVQAHGGGRVVAPGIDCGPDCIEKFAVGTTVTLAATPSPGAAFVGWNGACTGRAGTCTVVVDEATRVSAWFSAPVQVTLAGSGTGTVESSPSGLQCPADCAATFPVRSPLTLTATPAAGSDFDGWSGDCTGAARTCSVIADHALSVTAHFVNSRSLTVAPYGSGQATFTSDPAGLDCAPVCAASFPPNAVVTLHVVPDARSYLESWTDPFYPNCAGYMSRCQVTLTSDLRLTPRVSLKPVLDVVLAGAGRGRVVSEPTGIDCAPDCTEGWIPDTAVTLRAIPEPGSYIVGFDGACQASLFDTCQFFLRTSATATVTFGLHPRLTVSLAGGGRGRITSSPPGIDCGTTCAAHFSAGTSVTLTATADAGHRFEAWGGACAGQSASCTITLDQSRSAEATFVAAPPPGGGSGGGAGSNGGGGGGAIGYPGLMLLVLLAWSRCFLQMEVRRAGAWRLPSAPARV